MKTKFLILAALSFSLASFSQKNELKAAEKAMKANNAAAAKSAIESAAPLIGAADDKVKAQYYILRGNVYNKLAKSGENGAFEHAIKAYNDLIATEEASGKAKYTIEAKQKLALVSNDLVNSAIKDNEAENFKQAAEKLYLGYTLSKKDTVYLYYAASSAVNGKDYETALKYYNELKELNYDGSTIVYSAVDVKTGERDVMEKAQRDLMVKSKAYKDPQEERTPSKRAEIVKNIALIYTQTGDDEKALTAYKDARADNPNDVNLILNEANLYLNKLGDKDKFKALMAEAAEIAPDNPDLFYNIGVINMEQNNLEEARKAYKRAIEINPGYVNAQLNLSTTYVNEGNSLIDVMNELGNTKSDIAKYDDLKKKKDDLFREGSKVLEDALKLNPGNQGILTQLKNIYGALGDNDSFMRVKKILDGGE